MSAGPDYAGEFRRMMAENAADVLPALDRGEEEILKKIARAAKRYSITEDEICAALRECRVLRYYFAKDPQKQGMHERLAAEFIAAISGVTEFSVAAKGGKAALHIVGGEVVSHGKLRALHRRDARVYPKSVDFLWRFGEKQFYAYHKFTAEEGGAQENQYKDAHFFLQESVQNDMPECVFIALCDGAFYDAPDSVAGSTRMGALQTIAANAPHGNVFAMTTGELPAFLRLGFAVAAR